MSKASEWAKQALSVKEARPSLAVLDTVFQVSDTGLLELRPKNATVNPFISITYASGDAQEIARWILDTFGEQP